MEAAPHLPRWMSGQCKVLRELLGGLGEEWVAEDMEGVEGGEGGWGVDSDIVLQMKRMGGQLGTSLRGGSRWAWFETNRSMAPNGFVLRRLA